MYPSCNASTPFEDCMATLKNLTHRYQSTGKGKLLVDVKQDGEGFSVNVPNVQEGLFNFTRKHVESYVSQHESPILTNALINTLKRRSVDRPSDFLEHSLVSIVGVTGHGGVMIEVQNPRRFIGAVTISYLGLRRGTH